MSEFNITVESGSSVKLPTSGKYCDRDILITATGGGESDVNPLDALIDGSITEVTSNATTIRGYGLYDYSNLISVNFPNLKTIYPYAFANCTRLKTVKFPLVISAESNAFSGCSALTTVELPLLSTLKGSVFEKCGALTTIKIPKVNDVYSNALKNCTALVIVDFPLVTSIGSSFYYCKSLRAVVLRSETICSLGGNPFVGCYHFLGTVDATYNPNGDKDGYIYVPKSLIEDYKVATNWTVYASQFRALEDYTVDGTITGELDETKI